MAGHLFALQGDARKLACDAWLLPTDSQLRFTDVWFEGAPELARYLEARHAAEPWSLLGARRRPELHFRGGRTFELQDWPARPGAPAASPWATDTGGGRRTQLRWYLEGIEQFVERASRRVRERGFRRDKPLLAVPPVGTGAGGRGEERARLIREVAGRLSALAARHDVDLVFVSKDPASYALFQKLRPDAELPPGCEELIGRLARHARGGTLVPFIGAGASVGAGLPNWSELVEELRQLAPGIGPPGKGEDLSVLAQRIARKAGEAKVREKVRQIVVERAGRHSLIHGLLANLEPEGAITTNFDCLFETALAARGLPAPSVLRHKPDAASSRWLLKMHGDVDAPEDLVITADDYARFGRRGALLGIVQAMLMTRHLLFVGYGLGDRNFREGVKSVEEALSGSRASLGTVLALGNRRAKEPAGFEVVSFGEPRQIEILLDQVVRKADLSASFFLDERYSRALSGEERRLARRLRRVAGLYPALRGSAAWPHVQQLLERLGWRPESEEPRRRVPKRRPRP